MTQKHSDEKDLMNQKFESQKNEMIADYEAKLAALEAKKAKEYDDMRDQLQK